MSRLDLVIYNIHVYLGVIIALSGVGYALFQAEDRIGIVSIL